MDTVFSLRLRSGIMVPTKLNMPPSSSNFPYARDRAPVGCLGSEDTATGRVGGQDSM